MLNIRMLSSGHLTVVGLCRNSIIGAIRRNSSSQETTAPTAPRLVRVCDEQVPNSDRWLLRRLTLDNVKQRNALGLDMITQLRQAVDEAAVARDARGLHCPVLVIDSSSSAIFSSGHNLKEFTIRPPANDDDSDDDGPLLRQRVFDEFAALCARLRTLPMPTVAQVFGLAAAAGYQLAASCDMIVASERAAFSTPGVKFGVFCSTPGVALSRSVAPKIAMRMLLTGEPMGARDALTHGLISDLVVAPPVSSSAAAAAAATSPAGASSTAAHNDAQLLQVALSRRVNELAEQIGAHSRSVVQLGKRCFYEQRQVSDIDDAYALAGRAMLHNLTYVDTQRGLQAFAAKKKPVWTHTDERLTDN